MHEIGRRIKQDIKDFGPAIFVIAAYFVAVNLVFHAFCPMVILTGFPCPGCGMTRALFYLVTGHVEQSIQMHPMGIVAVCLLLYFVWNRYIIGRKAKGMMLLVGIAMILLVVVYIRRMYCYFPNRVPYVYTEHNLIARIFPYYEQILHDLKIL